MGLQPKPRRKVAVVGTGCSGLGALHALKDTGHEVHLFEKANRLGGHTNTCTFKLDGQDIPVDTGFIVLNTATYPNFIAFLRELNVEMLPTEMTFGVSRDKGMFEWAGTSLSAVFAQRKNIFSARMWRMIFDIVRFNQFALDLLVEEDESEEDITGVSRNVNGPADGATSENMTPVQQQSIGEYLDREGYSDAFRDDYLIPMTAAVWSTSPDKANLEFPAITLVRFMWNHHLLSTIAARPSWMTIRGGSQKYIDAVTKDFPKERIHLNKAAVDLENTDDGRVRLCFEGKESEIFDHVILATHGDTACSIISNSARPGEIEIMKGFRTTLNEAYLHSDLSLMPRRREAWSAWNYITTSSPTSIDSLCLTYNMTLLQHLPTTTNDGREAPPILVTLNPAHPPKEDTIQGRYTYRHPLYNTRSIRSQKLLPCIQNTRHISYVGAWTRYGFHEDGFSSGIKAAIDHLGGSVSWEVVDSTFSRGRRPQLTKQDYALRAVIRIVMVVMWLLEGLFGVAKRTPARKKID